MFCFGWNSLNYVNSLFKLWFNWIGITEGSIKPVQQSECYLAVKIWVLSKILVNFFSLKDIVLRSKRVCLENMTFWSMLKRSSINSSAKDRKQAFSSHSNKGLMERPRASDSKPSRCQIRKQAELSFKWIEGSFVCKDFPPISAANKMDSKQVSLL